jgi:hypothetical protein
MKQFLSAIIMTLLIPCATMAQSVDKLADRLADGIKDREGIKLAVLEFPYAGGKSSEGSVIIQERLTTALAQHKNIILIERSLLKKIMDELSLNATGAIDADTAKKLGKMIGADLIAVGTLNDISQNETEINARIVETETGKIAVAAAESVKRTWKDGAVVVNPPQNFGAAPLVQVAILLDTSSSMDGLIGQAREQIWKIINELVSSEKSGSKPAVQVALYEYGNSSLSAKSGYIRKVSPFTIDLDNVARDLFALNTNGGDEYCGMTIKEAVDSLAWSPKTDVYKAIFIAGNEPFTQGPVDYRDAILKAKTKNIYVNTIYCGSRQQGLAEQWKAGADLAEGDYANIDQSVQHYTVAAPQDSRISELSTKLNDTYVNYGAGSERKLKAKKEMEEMAKSAGASVASERAAFKASAPSAAQADSSWDVVSAIESGAMKKEDIKKDQLPDELKSLDKAKLDAYIEAKLAERKKIKQEITKLQTERRIYIEKEEKKQSGGSNTLDKAMINTIHKQATQRGHSFSK